MARRSTTVDDAAVDLRSCRRAWGGGPVAPAPAVARTTFPGATIPRATIPRATIPGATFPGATIPRATFPGATAAVAADLFTYYVADEVANQVADEVAVCEPY